MIADTVRLDPRPIRDAEVERLQRRFPGVRAWYGHHTRQWWAMLPPPSGRLVGGNPNLPTLEQEILRHLGRWAWLTAPGAAAPCPPRSPYAPAAPPPDTTRNGTTRWR